MNRERHDKRIHILIFESESHGAIQEILRTASKMLPGNVNILSFQLDDSFFRLVLASLREGTALSVSGKNRGGR